MSSLMNSQRSGQGSSGGGVSSGELTPQGSLLYKSQGSKREEAKANIVRSKTVGEYVDEIENVSIQDDLELDDQGFYDTPK